jgi:hypothetical protein
MKTTLRIVSGLFAAPAFVSAQTFGSQPNNNFGSSMYAPPGDQQVNGFTRSNGTYVEPYHRSQADGNPPTTTIRRRAT